MRVLIASPITEHRAALCGLLSRMMHQIDTAATQTEAMAKVGLCSYDVLLADDAWMRSLIAALRERAPNPTTSLVALLRQDDARLATEALKSGADDVLPTPTDTPDGQARTEQALLRCERLRTLATRGQEMQQKLSQAMQSKGIVALAGSMAHEMNQPLTVIVGLTELIIQDAQKHGDPSVNADAMRKACTRLGAIIRRLSAVTRAPTPSCPGTNAEAAGCSAGD
ncbi:MAG: histidine kinase dimerization/phospho-acceptor domain-containing protein [Anaerolineae bacterium]